jgi:lysophospholipase L1-like esterase
MGNRHKRCSDTEKLTDIPQSAQQKQFLSQKSRHPNPAYQHLSGTNTPYLVKRTQFLKPVFCRFFAALVAACWSLSVTAAPDMALLRVSGPSQPAEFSCPSHKSKALPNTPRPSPSMAEPAPPSFIQAYAAPAHSHTPGLKVGLWGDSHTASGTFTDSLLDTLRLPRGQTRPSFIAPTFGVKGIRHPLRRVCLSENWHLNMAYRTPNEGTQAYAKSLASLGTEDAGAFMWLDFRYPDAQTRLKWVDLHFSKDSAERSLVLGVTVDDGPEATVNLGPGDIKRLRVQADQGFATLRLRLIAGQIRIDGLAPVYEGKTQVILDVFSIPGATAKGWRVVDTAHLRQQDPLESGYDVVILQSGTNESLDPDFKAAVYESQLNASLTRLKAAYPRARCVLIGPPDARRSANTLRLINDSQYRLAMAKSCTHWHWQKTMGGPGASVQWLSQGLMQTDLLHLTPAGYEQSARSFVSVVPIKVR